MFFITEINKIMKTMEKIYKISWRIIQKSYYFFEINNLNRNSEYFIGIYDFATFYFLFYQCYLLYGNVVRISYSLIFSFQSKFNFNYSLLLCSNGLSQLLKLCGLVFQFGLILINSGVGQWFDLKGIIFFFQLGNFSLKSSNLGCRNKNTVGSGSFRCGLHFFIFVNLINYENLIWF